MPRERDSAHATTHQPPRLSPVERPQLPDFVHWLEMQGLKVGEASADLRFERTADGTIAFSVMKVDGKLDVIGPEDSAALASAE
jgi:hypothetical protein